jgi:methylglutaconyl-CoA hydratase
VRVEAADGILTATLDDPETRNVLTPCLLRGLSDIVARADHDPAVRVVVIANTGTTFCAGADLRPTLGGTSTGAPRLEELLSAIQRCGKPVIARVSGHVMGGGNGLVASCDFAFASDDSKFGFTEVRLGVVPAIISVVCLPKMRRGDALEAFLRGNRFSAARATELGLIQRALPEAELDAAIAEVIDDLKKGEPKALALAKQLVYEVPRMDPQQAFAWTAKLSTELFDSAEAREGIRAFRERRPAAWAK